MLSTESRMRGDMQVRFGGRYGKTYCRKAVRRSVPSLRLARSGDIIDLGILIYHTNDISRVLKLIENATPAPKDISVTNTTKTTLACCLFEGFMDFLSYLTLVKQGKLPPPCRQPDLIVLNSVNNLSKALSRLKAYKKIYCFLDNDDAGRKAVDLLREMNTATVYNVMEAFPYYKDVNDLLRDKKRMP